jgi:hypothetical protein
MASFNPLNKGHGIDIALVDVNKELYQSAGYTEEKWNLDISPIETKILSENRLFSTSKGYGTNIALGDITKTNYMLYGYTEEKWNLDINPVEPKFVNPLLNKQFIPSNKGHGNDITLAATTKAKYLTASYTEEKWNLDINPVEPKFVNPFIVSFNPANKGHGLDIDEINSYLQASYPSFEFGTKWGISEENYHPTLLSKERFQSNPALTTRKIYSFMEENIEGSLMHEGKVYRSLNSDILSNIISGTVGSQVVHTYAGDDLQSSSPIGEVPTTDFVYLVGGIENTTYYGGYGELDTAVDKTVTIDSNTSKNAIFYYIPFKEEEPIDPVDPVDPPIDPEEPVDPPIDPEEPVDPPIDPPADGDPDYFIYIQGNNVEYSIGVYLENESNICIEMPDGKIGKIALVNTEDLNASPIRIMTSNGIMSLRKNGV